MKFFPLLFLFLLSFTLASQSNQSTSHLERIVLGSGCFWGAEKGYEALPGVVDAVSGYADGYGVRPSYREITKYINKFNPNNHAEVVEVTYNKNIISTKDLLEHYFESHDPTQLNQQGNDIGTQYRSIILYTNKEQQRTAEKLIFEYQQLLTNSGYGQIATVVKSLDEFFRAETYHQDYIAKNPNGYCPDHSTGIRFAKDNPIERKDNSELLKGKNIVVIEPQGYCPYCEKFKALVAENYQGSIRIHFRLALQLDSLQIDTPTWATPTIIFLEEGKEIFSHQGYMSPKEFYKALGFFKLGDSEAYEVAFEDGTDARFCKEYDVWRSWD